MYTVHVNLLMAEITFLLPNLVQSADTCSLVGLSYTVSYFPAQLRGFKQHCTVNTYDIHQEKVFKS